MPQNELNIKSTRADFKLPVFFVVIILKEEQVTFQTVYIMAQLE